MRGRPRWSRREAGGPRLGSVTSWPPHGGGETARRAPSRAFPDSRPVTRCARCNCSQGRYDLGDDLSPTVMSGPAIFISHSGKDFAANDASIPADRRARLQYARDVRDLIVAELKKSLGAANVLFDKLRLEPGDQWQAKLHQWLGLCHGAVILLNQEAVASAWVRKET